MMERVLSIRGGDERTIKTVSAAGTLLLHAMAFILLSLITLRNPKPVELIELDWGPSSGAPNQGLVESKPETRKQQTTEIKPVAKAVEKKKVDLPRMKSTSPETLPAKGKAVRVETKQPASESTTRATGRRADRSQPAGAGKSTGYSIEWSGVGFRKLLSGRMPRYPEGTDKEMPVVLQFTVLPDGSVMGVIPLRRSDELLEREAISALQTWRFDPLPQQFEQKPQAGKVTFNFILE